MVDRAELTAIIALVCRAGVRLVSDEIYHGVTYPATGAADPRGVCAWEADESAVVISSFSKYWGMTGLAPRLDAAAGRPRAAGRRPRRQRRAVPARPGAVCRRGRVRAGVVRRVRRCRRRVRPNARAVAGQCQPVWAGVVRRRPTGPSTTGPTSVTGSIGGRAQRPTPRPCSRRRAWPSRPGATSTTGPGHALGATQLRRRQHRRRRGDRPHRCLPRPLTHDPTHPSLARPARSALPSTMGWFSNVVDAVRSRLGAGAGPEPPPPGPVRLDRGRDRADA